MSWRVPVVLIVVLRRHSVVRVFARITRMRVNGSGRNTAVGSRLILNADAARRDIRQPGNSQQSGNRPATTDSSEKRAHAFATAPIHGYGFVVTAISILMPYPGTWQRRKPGILRAWFYACRPHGAPSLREGTRSCCGHRFHPVNRALVKSGLRSIMP